LVASPDEMFAVQSYNIQVLHYLNQMPTYIVELITILWEILSFCLFVQTHCIQKNYSQSVFSCFLMSPRKLIHENQKRQAKKLPRVILIPNLINDCWNNKIIWTIWRGVRNWCKSKSCRMETEGDKSTVCENTSQVS